MSRKVKLVLITASSYFFSLLILFRWTFTDLTTESFGRRFQLYTSWGDFGFFRRGLVGTLFTESRLNELIADSDFFVYSITVIFLSLAYLIVLRVFWTVSTPHPIAFFQAGVFFSPAFFTHFAYSTGNLDIFIVLIFIVATWYAKNLWSLMFLAVIGILVHELFFFLVPALIYLKTSEAVSKSAMPPLAHLIGIAASSIGALAATLVTGKIEADQSEYDLIMNQRIPGDHRIGGYFELGSTVNQNLTPGLADNFWLWAFLPTMYAFGLAVTVAWNSARTLLPRLAVCGALLFPLAAQAVAGDYFRWVSLSAIVSIVSLIDLVRRDALRPTKWLGIFLVVAAVAGPLGAVGGRPWPLAQFVIEALLSP